MLVILSIMALTFASAFRSPIITQVSLVSVGYLKEKGVTFKFLVDGKIKKADLKGDVKVDGRTIRLHCNYGGDIAPIVIVCTADKATAKLAGLRGTVTLSGKSFGFTVPARPMDDSSPRRVR
jgi:hypothetical protein